MTPTIGHRPTAADFAAARILLEPWRWIAAPRFFELQHVPPDRPFLLVGNHTLMGVLDAPLLVVGLQERRDIVVRSLGDHLHFQVPLWRDLLERFGVVEGTPENCRALMRAGEPILVFPGGGREVFKHKGEQYQLVWKQRLGFVRLAIEHGFPIVPFAAVGAEECYDILVDGPELRASPIGPLLERVVPRLDEIPPLVAGIGPLPRPQRFYFWFAPPVETAAHRGREHDDALCHAVRDTVRDAVERGMRLMLAERERDPERDLGARIAAALRGALGGP